MAVDPNEAPEGYEAYEFYGEENYNCYNCAFIGDKCANIAVSCLETRRLDGKSVIFMKRKDHA